MKTEIERLNETIAELKKEYCKMSTMYVISKHKIDRLNRKIEIYEGGGIGSQLLRLIDTQSK